MVDIKEEEKYEQLRKLGQELHVPIPVAFLEIEVRDKNGKTISKHRQRSHSWCRNAYNCIFSTIAGKDGDDVAWGAGLLCWKKTSGVLQTDDAPLGLPWWERNDTNRVTVDDTSFGFGFRAPAANDDYGILVGSGVGAESFEDFALGTPIIEGSGAGQLNHVISEPHAITYTAGTKTLKNDLARFFNNNSGGNIDVNEVALVSGVGLSGAGLNLPVLFARDKLGATITVPDTGQLKVTYTIELVYAG